MSKEVTGHHDALPKTASETALPSASCVMAPMESR
jgi:hypothetical protein